MSHLIETSNMTTRVETPIPAVGLTPTGQAAVLAAEDGKRIASCYSALMRQIPVKRGMTLAQQRTECLISKYNPMTVHSRQESANHGQRVLLPLFRVIVFGLLVASMLGCEHSTRLARINPEQNALVMTHYISNNQLHDGFDGPFGIWVSGADVVEKETSPTSVNVPAGCWDIKISNYNGNVTTYSYFNGVTLKAGGIYTIRSREGKAALSSNNADSAEGRMERLLLPIIRGDINGHGHVTALEAGLKTEYEGALKFGYYHGQGTMTWSDGRKYTGAWADNKRNGQGTMTWPDGETYTGAWADNKRNGQGTNTLSTGETYSGAWADDKRSGQGTNTWPDGRKYTGAWANDKRNGQGTNTDSKGRILVGKWVDDRFCP